MHVSLTECCEMAVGLYDGLDLKLVQAKLYCNYACLLPVVLDADNTGCSQLLPCLAKLQTPLHKSCCQTVVQGVV